MTWRLACWLWVAVPILGIVPLVPIRLAVQWLMTLTSIGVIGVGLVRPRHSIQTPFGWMVLGGLVLAGLHWRQPTSALLWVSQATLLLGAAATLASHGESRWLRQAVIACAWMQVVVLGLQAIKVPLPWAQFAPPRHLAGTVGSIRPASILLGVACLWSRGWSAWGLGLASCLTGGGTVAPLVACWLWWTHRRTWRGALAGAVGLAVSGGMWRAWVQTLIGRLEVWRDWPLSWWGLGFKPFPSGWGDDTAFGRAMGWRDSHNVVLDWIGRFGLTGGLLLLGVGWWILRQSRTPSHRVMALVAAWIACWQSLEQFPILVIPMLVWWIGLCQLGERNAVSTL